MSETMIRDHVGKKSWSRSSYLSLVIVPLVFAVALVGCQDSAAEHGQHVPMVSRSDADVHEADAGHETDLEDAGHSDHSNHSAELATSATGLEVSAEQESIQESGMLDKASDLLKQATAKGGETARGAGKWVQDTLGSAADAGERTAEETLDWANQTFETLKSQGLTTANDTSQWLTQDWNNMESWEYKVLTLGETDDGLTKKLNALGKQGWECFETEHRSDGTRFFFKKPTFSYLRHLPFRDLIKLAPLMNNDPK